MTIKSEGDRFYLFFCFFNYNLRAQFTPAHNRMLWSYSKIFVTKKVKVSTKIIYGTYCQHIRGLIGTRLISENKQGLDVSKGFDELDEQVCTSTDLWEYFAGYLIETYRIPRGKNKGGN